jgi:D-glycero-D-manno-heptose 1,7-bisphosphate phosphatase
VKRAVFFDRDGILNEAVVRNGAPFPPHSLEELRIPQEAFDAVARVRDAGYLALAITNQPDVARMTASRAEVEAINERVELVLALDGTYTCFHDDSDACDCRKPKPGLLRAAARERGIDLSQSYMIGDRYKDVECGRSAGCTTVFVDRGYAETPRNTGADVTVSSLRDAVDAVLRAVAER